MMIEMQHLDKSYWADKTEVPVLKDVCFTVEEGEYVSIMGPSGSGKTGAGLGGWTAVLEPTGPGMPS